MGAVGLNGATSDLANPHDRTRAAASGWSKWMPVNAAAIGAHLIGATGLLVVNRRRVAGQAGVTASSVAKTVLTAGALGTTAWSAALGRQIGEQGTLPIEGATTPAEGTPPEAASRQEQLRALQWATPALTSGIVVVSALLGEQQRGSRVLRGMAKRAMQSGKAAASAGTAAGKHPARTAKALTGAKAAKHPLGATKVLAGVKAGKHPVGAAKLMGGVKAAKHPARAAKLVGGAKAAKHPLGATKALAGVTAGKQPTRTAKLLGGTKAAALGGKHPVRAGKLAKVLS